MTRVRFGQILVAAAALVAVASCKPEQKRNSEPEPQISAAPVFDSGETSSTVDESTLSASKSMDEVTVHSIPKVGMLPTRPDIETLADGSLQIRITPRMRAATDWTASFVAYYPAIRDCLAAHEDGRAFIADVQNKDPQTVIVTTGNNVEGSIGLCEIALVGGKPLSLTFAEHEELNFKGPVFYPHGSLSTYTITRQECYERETVISRPDGYLGIIVYTKPECADTVPATPEPLARP